MHAFNFYDEHGNLWYTDECLNCSHGVCFRFVRKLSEEEREKPIWEILGTTREIYYGEDNKVRKQFLEVSTSRPPWLYLHRAYL